jgi:hypothetical protein
MMRLTGLVFCLLIGASAVAQENSPYSRYGLGDLVPNQNILNRSMGGISAGYADYRTVNFVNPASYSNINYATFDFGAETNTRRLKSITPASRYSATNLNISYVQLGLPIRMKKANQKNIFLGVNVGLRPVSRINYKIYAINDKPGVDSVLNVYEGTGGVNDALFGAGLRIKNFSLGFNSGYRFGNKSYSTRVSVLNDTVFHYPANYSYKTNFGGMFFTLGTQLDIKVNKKGLLRLGAYAGLKGELNGEQDVTIETVSYDAAGASYRIDSVFKRSNSGTVNTPSNWGAGFTYLDSAGHWMVGADYEQTAWSQYKFFGNSDKVKNNWKVRVGAEYLPASLGTPLKKYFSFVKYRAGFYYGPDYINLGSNLVEYGFTFGAGFPLKLRKSYYETQTSFLNTAIEIGSRGNKNTNLRENLLRISVGFSLSDLWFNRSKYY